MNTKFYCEHNQTVCLTKFAVGQIENQLNGCKCKNCGSELCIETTIDGTNVLCEKHPYSHVCGYRIDCGIFTDMPQIKKLKLRVN